MKNRILIVDDFKGIRELLSSTLTKKGYDIDTAANGQEAIDILSGTPTEYDLILSDYNMPQMNGYELLKSVRENPDLKNKPFILLTTEADPEKMKSAKNAGLTAWVKKPYKLNAFLSQIDYAINKEKK